MRCFAGVTDNDRCACGTLLKKERDREQGTRRSELIDSQKVQN